MCQLEYYHLFLEQSIPILMAITKMILTEDRVLQFFFSGNAKDELFDLSIIH